MAERNAFRVRPEFKKRIISASITEAQEDALNEMMHTFANESGTDTAPTVGAVIKLALAELYDRMGRGERFVP